MTVPPYNKPPLCVELPYQSNTTQRFEVLIDHAEPWPVFLDSTHPNTKYGRYDIQAADPFLHLVTNDKITTITYRDGNSSSSTEDPFSLLQEKLESYNNQASSFLPFCGGAIGYFSYDLARRLENIPETAESAENIPEMAVAFYDWAIITDHQQKRCWLASYALDPKTQSRWDTLRALLEQPAATKSRDFRVKGQLHCNMNPLQYQQNFERIQHYILEGDCYQVNLAKRFSIRAEGDPWHAYQLLRKHNSAPFSAFLATPDVTILSSSPERLLQVKADIVETKPIKGTRPRDLKDPQRDRLLATELQNSDKDRAENLMIVDLLRNDLGKVCVPGSIEVPNPFTLESFATVHHLVSTITGKLANQQNAVSLLRACFPGGSITGAPKLRAIEIIEALEPHRRGVYCGSIGYIGFDGNMDTNIAIRTLVYSEGLLRFWAGGGIVSDSKLEEEYQEVNDKAAAMFSLLEQLR